MITIIKVSELGRVYIPIYFKPLNDITMLGRRFKVDTGADRSTIFKEDLYSLGYNYEWILSNITERDSIELANKTTVEVGVIQLPLMNILGYECKKWPFIVIMEGSSDFRNLIGRDLLSGFNYCFDNDNKEFTISKTLSYEYIGYKQHEVKIFMS